VLKGKLARLLRKGLLCLSFAAAAVNGAAAAVPADTARQEPTAISVLQIDTLPLQGLNLATPADPKASAATSAVLSYLANLPSSPDHRLISGQWTGYGSVDAAEIQSIDKLTGQRVGLIGADYLDFNGPRISTGRVNASMIEYWKQGSLVDIDVHFPNPWTGGGPGDKTVPNFADVVTPGTPAYAAYMANLDKIATGLQQLQDAGVVVLFRPMMEMDGNWFWWGQQPQFPKLWAQTFDYLTNTKGLHNLLWVYSASGRDPLSYYPGAQYADVVGCDAYSYGAWWRDKITGYDALLNTGKPFALTEFGLQSSDYIHQNDPPEDLFTAISNIKSNMPRTVYFMAWSNAKSDGNYWAIDAQMNASAALNDPWIQNGAVPWNPATRPVSPAPKK
jgi:mannan endo-1,4-beta-mannosidase